MQSERVLGDRIKAFYAEDFEQFDLLGMSEYQIQEFTWYFIWAKYHYGHEFLVSMARRLVIEEQQRLYLSLDASCPLNLDILILLGNDAWRSTYERRLGVYFALYWPWAIVCAQDKDDFKMSQLEALHACRDSHDVFESKKPPW